MKGSFSGRRGLFYRGALAVVALSATLLLISVIPRQRTTVPVASEAAVPGARGSPTTASTSACCAILLAIDGGTGRLGMEISRLQAAIRSHSNAAPQIEQLGWMFVAQARDRFDPGYYKFAEQAALCLEQRGGARDAALLLRGHALQNLHQFKAAEPLAIELVKRRGAPFDYGLLGDVLVELGRTSEAVAAYQHMIDARPDAQGYSRVAYVRWLTGDLEGAIEVMRMAAEASGPDRENAAWMQSRLAFYLVQAGMADEAGRCIDAALQWRPAYPPALMLRGRLALSGANTAAAISDLRRAAVDNPVPEYLWYLAEALCEGGRTNEAADVEARILRQGEAADARTFALFLATRAEKPALAVRVARLDLSERGDVFAHDTLAWSLCAAGQMAEACREMEYATRDRTADARLLFHAGSIAAKVGRTSDARVFLARAEQGRRLLLPSERRQLQQTLREIDSLAGNTRNQNVSD